MPCAFGTELTVQQQETRDEELRGLERSIENGKVTVKRNGNKIEFVGWNRKNMDGPGHWHDDCAYRTLSAKGSPALRRAMQKLNATNNNARKVTR